MNKKAFVLVTAALPYSNNVPHIGHLVGSHLPADIFARYQRFKGNYVVFIGGTDEHGTPIEVEALKKKTTPENLTDRYYEIHRKIYEWFNISYDNFSRTSKSKVHSDIVKKVFLRMFEAGFIIEKVDELPYDPKSDRFLPDRYVIGKCPYCGYEKARGDQCENCGRLLDPKNLINPRNAITRDPVVFKKTKHLYFDLKRLSTQLERWIKEKEKEFSDLTYSLSISILKAGLKERSITRDIRWGIPVPYKELWNLTLEKIFNKIDFSSKDKLVYSLIESLKELNLVVDQEEESKLKSIVEMYWPKIDKILKEFNHFDEYKNKVFYVWFDAPIGYLSFTMEILKEDFSIDELPDNIEGIEFTLIDDNRAEIKIDSKRFIVHFTEDNQNIYLENIEPPYYFKYFKKIVKALLTYKQKDRLINKLNWKKFWMEGEIYHFIGKDNIPFHTIFWPGIILSSNACKKEDKTFSKPIALPKNVFGYAYLLYEGRKISKSQRWGVFCDSIIEESIHPDYWRFYLAYLIPENKDMSFSWKEFTEIINKELVNNIGNLTHRVLKFAWKNYKEFNQGYEEDIIKICKKFYQEIEDLLNKGKIASALRKILEMSNQGNILFQNRKPWENPKNNMPFIKSMIIYLLTMYAMLSLYIPDHSKKFFDLLGIEELNKDILEKILENPEEFKPSIKREPTPLFKKLDEETILKIESNVTKPKY